MTAEVSHGRGGAGNINPDDTKYVDGEIVRQGEAGSHGDGAFSTGRGGGGNIGDPGKAASLRADKDVVPDAAVRPAEETDHHVGRGGAANVLLADGKKKVADAAPPADAPTPTSTADRIKKKVLSFLGKK